MNNKDFENNSVLLQTKEIVDPKDKRLWRIVALVFGFAGIFVLIASFVNLYLTKFLPSLLIVFVCLFIIGLWLFFVYIYYLISKFNKSRTSYYITSKKVVKLVDKPFLYKKPKKKEIYNQKISHLIDWDNTVEIVPLRSNGKSFYHGDETEFHHDYYSFKSIRIRLSSPDGDEIRKKIIQTLKAVVPLAQHPFLGFIYYQK
ncbi:MAG: hypothetical protein ACFFBI_04210 [Promethearchaeota archaeon]